MLLLSACRAAQRHHIEAHDPVRYVRSGLGRGRSLAAAVKW